MKMKKIGVHEAVGMRLCHDITKVVPGVFKGTIFKRDHVIRPEDIEELLSIGKEHIYVWEDNAGEIHEDDAAVRIAKAISGKNISFSEPEEGKSVLKATAKGLLKVNGSLLGEINSIEHVTIPTLPDNFMVEQDGKIAAARIVPLVTQTKNVIRVEELCALKGPVLEVKPYRKLQVGLVITGNEVFKGRIEDKFGPVIQRKMEYFGAQILGRAYCPDCLAEIEDKIWSYARQNVDLIIVTGGMSVDPDDLTPGAIKNTGAEVITHGVPVQPGNMFMLAYLQGIPVLGVPGAAIYFKTTILDLVLPRIFAGELMTREDFIKMGTGGLCMGCKVCRYPDCYLGR